MASYNYRAQEGPGNAFYVPWTNVRPSNAYNSSAYYKPNVLVANNGVSQQCNETPEAHTAPIHHAFPYVPESDTSNVNVPQVSFEQVRTDFSAPLSHDYSYTNENYIPGQALSEQGVHNCSSISPPLVPYKSNTYDQGYSVPPRASNAYNKTLCSYSDCQDSSWHSNRNYQHSVSSNPLHLTNKFTEPASLEGQCAKFQKECMDRVLSARLKRRASPVRSISKKSFVPPPHQSSPSTWSSSRNATRRLTQRRLSSFPYPLKKPSKNADGETRRRNNCAPSNKIEDKPKGPGNIKTEDILKERFWIRSSPAELYYEKDKETVVLRATERTITLCNTFEEVLVKRGQRARGQKPPYQLPPRKKKLHTCCQINLDSDSSNDSDDDGLLKEYERKKLHRDRLHAELWYNDPGEMNNGPFCHCSAETRQSGIRHNIYPGELSLEKCDINSNNAGRLYHYRITISPPTNFLIRTPTVIEHDCHEFIFEGFSMFSHQPLKNLPVCKFIRYNIEYTILYIEEQVPQNFVIRELELFHEFLFKEILELVDFDFKAAGDASGCPLFHFMPRFVRELPQNGKELLSMNFVMSYLLERSKPLIPNEILPEIQNQWQKLEDEVKGMVVTYPGKKPCSIRVDQIVKNNRDSKKGEIQFPEIVHCGIRPPQLIYDSNHNFIKARRDYVKFRHRLAYIPKPSYEDKTKLEAKERKLREIRAQIKIERVVSIVMSSEGFYRTGIMCDIVQHAMVLPVLVSNLRFHLSLDFFENKIHYKFQSRSLLQLAFTHSSYSEQFGTIPDHAKNSLRNCGIHQPVQGDPKIHYMHSGKRRMKYLEKIMSRFANKREFESSITHYERLEFLGDAVVEFVSAIHLFHLFPWLEDGGLKIYMPAIVQNAHLAVLAKNLGLDEYMRYDHNSGLCLDLALKSAMADCFEALIGALFLDGGVEVADRVFGEAFFEDNEVLLNVWKNYPRHPLQEEETNGDRKWIRKYEFLAKLTEFEKATGIEFTHIRLLARAFIDPSIGYTNLTLGSNQSLAILGETVLKLIISEYLYKYFPEHREGHLSLLRSSLMNSRTLAVVCDDLGMSSYAVYSNSKDELKTKDRADLFRAFFGALYVDKGLIYCQTFCNVCFFPRLHDFILNHDWNDPKSKLKQYCRTLRSMEGGDKENPVYKVIQSMGPSNKRVYTVAVYFKGKRLATASAQRVTQAERYAAKVAVDNWS